MRGLREPHLEKHCFQGPLHIRPENIGDDPGWPHLHVPGLYFILNFNFKFSIWLPKGNEMFILVLLYLNLLAAVKSQKFNCVNFKDLTGLIN